MEWLLILAALCGVVMGYCLHGDENGCPAIEYGYDCKGSRCDHRKSELYKAKMIMAEHEEKRRDDNTNLWGGNKDA